MHVIFKMSSICISLRLLGAAADAERSNAPTLHAATEVIIEQYVVATDRYACRQLYLQQLQQQQEQGSRYRTTVGSECMQHVKYTLTLKQQS